MASDRAERVRMHYQQTGLESGWTLEQVHRLCVLLQWTTDELMTVCGIKAHQWKKWKNEDHFPVVASIHFEMLRRAAMAAMKPNAPIVPVMPVHLMAAKEAPHHD